MAGLLGRCADGHLFIWDLALAGVPPLAGSSRGTVPGVWEAHLAGPFLMLALTAF